MPKDLLIWELGSAEKPLKYLYLLITLALLLLTIGDLSRKISLAFISETTKGEIISIYCSSKEMDRKTCTSRDNVYKISYSLNNKKHSFSTGPNARKIQTPSSLYFVSAQVGDHVYINVSRFNPEDAILKDDILYELFFSTSFFVASLFFVLHSVQTIRRTKKCGSN